MAPVRWGSPQLQAAWLDAWVVGYGLFAAPPSSVKGVVLGRTPGRQATCVSRGRFCTAASPWTEAEAGPAFPSGV